MEFFLVICGGVSTDNRRICHQNLRRLITATATFLLALLREFRRNLNHLQDDYRVVSVLLLGEICPSKMFRVRGVSRQRFTTFKGVTRLLIFGMVVMRFYNGYQPFMVVSRRHGALYQILASGQLSG